MTLSLAKDSERVLVSAYVPAQPAVPPLAFHMYAPPLPLGWRYEPYIAGGVRYPRDLASFATWNPQIKRAPIEYAPGSVTYTFVALADLAPAGYSTGLPDGSYPVYGANPESPSETVVTGYMVRVTGTGTPLAPRHWGPIDHMTFIDFPDVATEGSYGYPAGAGPFVGQFDVPTVAGIQRVSATFRKDFRGVLLRDPSTILPAYCTQGGPARVVAIGNFPGRAAVPAVAAEYRIDHRAGWNAGANSIDDFGGDCRVTFTPYVVGAVAVGFAPASRAPSTSVENLAHAFHFDQPSGSQVRYCILERGVRVSAYDTADASVQFVIERIGGVVTYQVDGYQVHVSAAGSFGRVRVGTALYLAGDGVY